MQARDAKPKAEQARSERVEEKPRRESESVGGEMAAPGRMSLPGGTPGDHAAILNRTAGSRPGLAAHALLQLQRQFGNRHVQRVVALARQEAAAAEGEISPQVEQSIAAARGGGRGLDNEVRGRMETSFSADFSGVRVHTGAQADRLNRELSARAFTTGSDIFFRDGEYNPGSSGGRELLAHELTHVVQQQGAVQTSRLTLGPPGDRFEQEAESVARQVMRQEEVSVQPGAAGVSRSIQREPLTPELAPEEPLPVEASGGTFDQAADTFAYALRYRLGQARPNVGIAVINGANIRLYDLDAQAVGGSFRITKPGGGLGVGVFAQDPGGDRRLHQLYQVPGQGWQLSPKGVGGGVDFARDVEPLDDFLAALRQFKAIYYVVPRVDTGVVPEEDLPKEPPPEERPEFMKFEATGKAELPAWPAAVVPLTPQVAGVGSTGKYYCRLDKYNPWAGTLGNVVEYMEPVNFHWEVLKLDSKLLVTGKETATRWKGIEARFETKARHIRDDEKTMLGEEGQSIPEKVVRRYMTEQMAMPRRILGYTGTAALSVIHTLAGGGRPTYEDYIDFKFDEPGDYFVRCLATPMPGAKSTRRRATSVAGAMVSVFDIKEVSAEALLTTADMKEQAAAGLEQIEPSLEALRLKRAATSDRETLAEIDFQIKRIELKKPYLEALQKAAGDTLAVRAVELDRVRAELAMATGKGRPAFRYQQNLDRFAEFVKHLREEEKRIAGQIERADTKLGDKVTRTGSMSAVLVDDTSGARTELFFSIGERRFVTTDRLEVVIADITNPKGRRFTGMGSGALGQGRSDAWHEAMRDLRRNLGQGRGWLAYEAPSPYSAFKAGLENPMQLQVGEIDQIRETADDAATALSIAAVLAAPFTGGSSLAILAVLAPVQIGSSLYNIVNRAMYDDLHLDEEAIGNLIDIATVGLAKVSTAGKLASRGVKIVANASRIAIQLLDHGQYVLMTYSTYQEVMRDVPGETPQEARARKLRALLMLFHGASIPVATHLWPPGTTPPSRGRAADAGGAPPVPKDYLDVLPPDVLKNAPPVVNKTLDPDTVHIRYEVKDGVITRMWMEIGPGTKPDMVALHVPAARDMARYTGLSGRVRLVYEQVVAWLKRNPHAEPGSRAWEAEREVKKLQRIIEERAALYDREPSMRDELRKELDHLEAQLIEHARDVDLFDVEGRGLVAAEGRGAGGESTFGPKTSKTEAFRKLGGFETKPGKGGKLEAASDFRRFVDALVHEGIAGSPDDVAAQLPEPKGLSHATVLDQVKAPNLAKLVDRASDPKRLRSLASYREARKGTTTTSEALYQAGSAEAKRIADLLPEADRAAFLSAWEAKMPKPAAAPAVPKPAAPAAPAAPVTAETPKPAAETPKPAVETPKPAEPAPKPAEPAVPDANRAAQEWLDNLRAELPESAQRRLDGMARGKTPAETKALVEKLGGKAYLEGGARIAAEKAAAEAASPARAQAIKDTLAADPGFLSHPDVEQAIKSGDVLKLRSEMAAEMTGRALLEGPFKGKPGVRVLRGVRVIREQPYKTVADARTALNAASMAETGEPYGGVIFLRDGKVYTISTDIDVLVLQDVPGQPSKVLRYEEVKSGKDDKPGKAQKQVDKATKRLKELAAGDTTIHLELADETDITATIDAASAEQAEKKTRGMLDNRKEFDESLDVTSGDLLKSAQELMAEEQKKKASGGGTPPPAAPATPAPAPASPSPAPAPASPTPAPASPTPAPAPPAPVPAPASPTPAAPAPAPVHKTLDQLLTPDKSGFADKDLQDAYARYVQERKKAGEKPATPEEWVSLTRGGPRERLEKLLGPDYAFGTGTGEERLLPLTDFTRPADYTQPRLDADLAAVLKNPAKLWERLKRLQDEGVTGGEVGESLFNILKGNAAEILSAKIQATEVDKVQKEHPDARLYDDVRARIYLPNGTLSKPVLFTDNVVASKRGKALQIYAVFEVKAGSKGGQEATTQIFDWIEGKLDEKIEIQVGGDTYVYDPHGTAANRVVGLARGKRHLIVAKGAEHLGLDSGDKTVTKPDRHTLPQTADEINFLARTLIDKFIKKTP